MPRSRAYLAATCLGALALSQVSFPGLTGTGAYFFDSVSLSAFARVASRLGLPEASLLYSLAPMAIAALTLAVPLRRRGAPELFALLAIAISAWMSLGVYATDRLVTTWSVRTFGSSPPDWLDRSHLGPARYLALPYANTFYGTYLESWNRDLRGVVLLDTQPPDPFPAAVASVARDGTLQIDGKPAKAQTLIANVSGTTIGLEGHVVRRPREGLVAYRIPAARPRQLDRRRAVARRLDRPAPPLPSVADRVRPLRPEPLRPGRDAAAQDRHRQAHLRHPRRHPATNRRTHSGRPARDVGRRAELAARRPRPRGEGALGAVSRRKPLRRRPQLRAARRPCRCAPT